ncbi:hypothetical protein E2562_025235, partial [Oryza meyeriana var. granulata]
PEGVAFTAARGKMPEAVDDDGGRAPRIGVAGGARGFVLTHFSPRFLLPRDREREQEFFLGSNQREGGREQKGRNSTESWCLDPERKNKASRFSSTIVFVILLDSFSTVDQQHHAQHR